MTRKIHVVLKKEDLETEKLGEKIAVVFDIILATSTITAALEQGAESVVPVYDWKEAAEVSSSLPLSSTVLAGEYNGKTMEGFLDPYPKELGKEVKEKTLLLSTTNGTVALKKSMSAKKLYAASLLNTKAVAVDIVKHYQNETVLLICGGSRGSFSMEDFYGAGYMVDCLLAFSSFQLTDAAKAAQLFYQSQKDHPYELLRSTRIGKILSLCHYEEELAFISQKSAFTVIPLRRDGKLINVEHKYGGLSS
ncbi:MAG: 2-phosphosulfolactate phosphatase [Bacillales bacterium]|nr:2-phosphosulfolactate phosphatase [Bacillales bacterium]